MDQETTENTIARPVLRVPITGLLIGLSGEIFAVTRLTPNSGPVTILLFLALLFLIFLSSSAIILQLTSYKILKKTYSWPRVLYTATLISAGGIFLVGLQTLGQLQVIDVVLVLVFEVLLNFYIFRRF